MPAVKCIQYEKCKIKSSSYQYTLLVYFEFAFNALVQNSFISIVMQSVRRKFLQKVINISVQSVKVLHRNETYTVIYLCLSIGEAHQKTPVEIIVC